MSWIKITQYLPGDTRRIQIWVEAEFTIFGEGDMLDGNWIGSYSVSKNEFIGLVDPVGRVMQLVPLKYVTHWAELLGEPEDLKK